ncbi:MAG: iron ABC transporter permease [Clostridiales bacterium]|nr:iron ABC transporter permease [Clostridiales bacterium]
MKPLQTSCIPNNRKKIRLLLLLAVLTAVLALLSLALGSVWLPPDQVLSALLGGSRDSTAAQILLFARLPRTLGCLLAGAALAASGAVIQSVLNNPLAAPNIIGVNSGAGFAVALCGAFGSLAASGGVLSSVAPVAAANSASAAASAALLTPVFAFLGALFGIFLVLFLAERTGASKLTLVLAGLAISGIFSAATDAVVTFVPDALLGYSDFRIGGLSGLSMERVLPALWIILPALLILLLLTNELDLLMLGTETAQSLGLRAKPVRLLLLALAAALAGAAVSFCGLLGFIGIIVPHILRRLIGEESKFLLPGSILGGAAFLTFCDILARVLFSPYELPVGIVLSLLGGPFFLWLLFRQRGGRTHD